MTTTEIPTKTFTVVTQSPKRRLVRQKTIAQHTLTGRIPTNTVAALCLEAIPRDFRDAYGITSYDDLETKRNEALLASVPAVDAIPHIDRALMQLSHADHAGPDPVLTTAPVVGHTDPEVQKLWHAFIEHSRANDYRCWISLEAEETTDLNGTPRVWVMLNTREYTSNPDDPRKEPTTECAGTLPSWYAAQIAPFLLDPEANVWLESWTIAARSTLGEPLLPYEHGDNDTLEITLRAKAYRRDRK